MKRAGGVKSYAIPIALGIVAGIAMVSALGRFADAQGPHVIYSKASIVTSAGSLSGTGCGPQQLGLNTTGPTLYGCVNGTFSAVSGGSGSAALFAANFGFSTVAAGTGYVVMQGLQSSVDAAAADSYIIAPRAGTLGNLHVSATVAEGATATMAVTIYRNGSTGALTCTLASNGSSCSDATDTVSVSTGDLLTWQIAQTNAGPGAYYYISATFQ